jgi:hypothetical protein
MRNFNLHQPLQIGQQLPPLCLSLRQLKKILQPITAGYTWGEETITDLWLLGAPMPPMAGQAQTEPVRLIVPSMLIKWLQDVLQRQGRPLDDSAKLYAQMMSEERQPHG